MSGCGEDSMREWIIRSIARPEESRTLCYNRVATSMKRIHNNRKRAMLCLCTAALLKFVNTKKEEERKVSMYCELGFDI